jgi:NADH-quinone oxidoreductase subunit K
MNNETFSLALHYQLIAGILFALGLIGFLVRRNMIVMFLCAEMMLQGVALSLVGWSQLHDDWGGQVLVVFIITVAACEAGLGLAMILVLARTTGVLDITLWQDLREQDQPAFYDREIPEERAEDQVWPQLTPSGIEPEVDPEKELVRPHV